jgi:hypothetical protein
MRPLLKFSEWLSNLPRFGFDGHEWHDAIDAGGKGREDDHDEEASPP